MGTRDTDPKLLCPSGMKGCPPQVFRVLCAELPCQTLKIVNCNIRLRQNNSLDLVLIYMVIAANTKKQIMPK